MWNKIKHFSRDEFVCACCGEEKMDQEFLHKLDGARDLLDIPFVITSGYRCPAHNSAVSSTGETGPHTTGKAADIALSGKNARDALVMLAHVFNGIGLNQKGAGRFIHVDLLNRRIWTY